MGKKPGVMDSTWDQASVERKGATGSAVAGHATRCRKIIFDMKVNYNVFRYFLPKYMSLQNHSTQCLSGCGFGDLHGFVQWGKMEEHFFVFFTILTFLIL